MTLPSNIVAHRLGVGESEYDELGEQAPITWICGCGARLKLERFDWEEEEYVPVPQDRKDAFLAEHTGHKCLCFKCRKVEVDFVDAWCEACEKCEGERMF